MRLLAKTRLTPNIISWIGFVITLGAAALIVTGNLLAAGFVVLIAGFFDIIDGALARKVGKATPFGAVLDSTIDRLSELVLLVAILVIYIWSPLAVLLVVLALVGSLMVSYVRARAEAVGFDCRVGLLTRTERVIILALGLILSFIDYALIIAVVLIAVLSFFTVGQRLVYVWRQEKSKKC